MQNSIFKDLIGVPFVNGGRDYKTGLDCWGVVLEYYKRIGITLPDYKIDAYCTPVITESMQAVLGNWKKLDYPQENCVASFAIDPYYPLFTQHFGIYLGYNKFIHTRGRVGVTIESFDSPLWKNKSTGFWEWQG